MFNPRLSFVQTLLAAILIASPALAQRLPTTVVPEHYDISVEPDLASATFTGAETIRVRLSQPSKSIVLNAAEIQFDKVTITAAGRPRNATVQLDAAKDQATFSVADVIPAGTAEIAIAYRGLLNDQLRGLYLSKANNRRYAVTQLEATDARRMFPSFDEPAFKATFSVTATIDQGDHAISNGSVVSDTPVPGKAKHIVVFERTPKMSTYLVALAVGDFECESGAAEGIPIRICATPDKKGQTGLALEAAQFLVQYFNHYYGVKYPFKKLDVVAVPDFAAGAMENTAAIFYRETYLLADPKSASVAVRENIAKVLAHEMAHQWFGDLVTMQWWDDIWLNEGFATWMETKPLKAWKPEWHEDLDEVQANQTALNVDALKSTRPIRSRASTPAEINELFDGIAYQKGGAVLRMVESWIGDEAFRAGVNAYIDKFQYANARAEDFWTTMATRSGKPVDRVMKSFVDQPGVPLVTIDVACASGTASVSVEQQRYVRDGATAARGTAGQLWDIPICVKDSKGKTTCDVVSARSATLKLDACPAWIMPNAGARGYYRSALTPDWLRKIAPAVASLDPAERMALVSDEWAVVRAGRHGIGEFLGLASGFATERTAAVMQTLAGTLTTIGDDVTTDATRQPYRAWLGGLLRPALTEVGWSGAANEPDNRRELRATLVQTLGRAARDPEVLSKSRELVLHELDRPGSVEPTLLNVVVNLAALGGDAALHQKYVARAKAARDPEEQYRYLNALPSFADPALVRRTVEYILSPEVRNQDVSPLLAAALGNPDTRSAAWETLQARWDDLQKKLGGFAGNGLIVSALASFCDAGTAAGIEKFFSAHKVPDAERTLQQSIERINSCAAFAARERDGLARWLQAATR